MDLRCLVLGQMGGCSRGMVMQYRSPISHVSFAYPELCLCGGNTCAQTKVRASISYSCILSHWVSNLEIMVIDMESQGDVSFQCQRVANLLVCKVIIRVSGHSCVVWDASENCLWVSIQSSVLTLYLGSVMSMKWDGCQGAVEVPFHWTWRCMTKRKSLYVKTVDGRFVFL